jgi:hypothetical protein
MNSILSLKTLYSKLKVTGLWVDNEMNVKEIK